MATIETEKYQDDFTKMRGLVDFCIKYPARWSRAGSVKELTFEKAKKFIEYLRTEHEGYVAFDTETDTLAKVNNRLVSIQFSIDDDTGYVICLDRPFLSMTLAEAQEIKKRLRELYEDKDTRITWVAHNAQFDICQLYNQLGVKYIERPIVDTMLYIHLLDENRIKPSYWTDDNGNTFKATNGLKAVCHEFFNFTLYDKEAVEARGSGNLLLLPRDKFLEYSGMDGYVTFRLILYLDRVAEKYGYRDTAHRFHRYLYSGAMQMFSWISSRGFYVDVDHLKHLLSDKSPILSRLLEIKEWYKSNDICRAVNSEICHEMSGGRRALVDDEDEWVLDMNKTKHREKLFFTSKHGCKLTPIQDKKTKSKYSTGTAFQEEYKDNEIVATYSEEQDLKKLKSSYLDSIWNAITGKGRKATLSAEEKAMALDSVDGAVHPNFHLNGTVTGRLSVTDPNVQQVPRSDTSMKKTIKCLYRARPGYVILQADFCANEIRFWAAISADPYLCENFNKSYAMGAAYRNNPTDPELEEQAHLMGDIHKQTAALMYGKDIKEITKNERQAAKSLSLGIMYQRGEKSVSQQLKKSEEETHELFGIFFKNYTQGVNWSEEQKRLVAKYGYVVSPLGRVRHLGGFIEAHRKFLEASRDESKKKAESTRLWRESNIQLAKAERLAVNSPVQGLANDLALMALQLLHKYIIKNGKDWHIVNTVHDSVVLEIPIGQVKEAAEVIRVKFTEESRVYVEKYFGWTMPTHIDIDFEIGQLRNKVCPKCGKYYSWWSKDTHCSCRDSKDENVPTDPSVRPKLEPHGLNMGYGTLVGWNETSMELETIMTGVTGEGPCLEKGLAKSEENPLDEVRREHLARQAAPKKARALVIEDIDDDMFDDTDDRGGSAKRHDTEPVKEPEKVREAPAHSLFNEQEDPQDAEPNVEQTGSGKNEAVLVAKTEPVPARQDLDTKSENSLDDFFGDD